MVLHRALLGPSRGSCSWRALCWILTAMFRILCFIGIVSARHSSEHHHCGKDLSDCNGQSYCCAVACCCLCRCGRC